MTRAEFLNSGLQCLRSVVGIYLSLLLIGCAEISGTEPTQEGVFSEEGLSMPLPAFLATVSDCGTLTVEVVVDEGPSTSLKVDCLEGTASGSIPGLSEGTHRFTVNYSMNGVLVATAETTAVIIGGESTRIDFSTVLINDDLDGDGFSGPIEIEAGSDPNNTSSVPQPPDGTIDNPASDTTIQSGEAITFSGSGTNPDNNLPSISRSHYLVLHRCGWPQ